MSSGAVLLAEARRHKLGLSVASIAALALLVAAGFGTYRWLIGDRRSAASGQQMSITRLTSSGAVTGCVSVSPDGRSVVFCERDATTGQVVLRLRQVATGATIKLSELTGQTTFSPDGNFVYVTQPGAVPARGALFVIPALGGGEEPRKLLTDIAGAAAVSHDGERLAFARHVVAANAPNSSQVIEVKRDGTDPRVVHAGRVGEAWFWPSSLSWSPDGRSIAAGYRGRDIGMLMAPVLIDVATGKVRQLTDQRWHTVSGTAWLHDGSGVVFAATHASDSAFQLWLVSRPGGEVKRITNDLHNYAAQNFDVDAAGTIVARQIVSTGNLWISDAKGDGLRQLTSGSGSDRVVGWMDDGRVLYMTDAPEKSLWSVSADGGAPKRLPIDAGGMEYISIAPGQSWVAYGTAGVPNIWRVNLDGTGRRQLTQSGYDRVPRVTRNGREILYDHWGGGTPSVWKMPSGGGTPIRLVQRAGLGTPSPDGQRFLALTLTESTDESTLVKLGIFRMSDGTLEGSFEAATPPVWFMNQLGQWSTDGQSMIFRRSPNGISNLWTLPLGAVEPKQFTRFDSDMIFSYAFSPDGTRIAISRGRTSGDVVMIRNFR
jgi:Tol biopolymer transport system component